MSLKNASNAWEMGICHASIDTNYRRLIEGRSIDISVGGVHNLVVGSDLAEHSDQAVSAASLTGIMADATGLKQSQGRRGELHVVVEPTTTGLLQALGTFVNTDWSQIEQTVKQRIKDAQTHRIPFIYHGEPGLGDFLADVVPPQRCVWHAPRGLYHALWEDGLKKKHSQADIGKLQQIVGIELPAEQFELLKAEDKEIWEQYWEEKLAIKGYFKIQTQSVIIHNCHNF